MRIGSFLVLKKGLPIKLLVVTRYSSDVGQDLAKARKFIELVIKLSRPSAWGLDVG